MIDYGRQNDVALDIAKHNVELTREVAPIVGNGGKVVGHLKIKII